MGYFEFCSKCKSEVNYSERTTCQNVECPFDQNGDLVHPKLLPHWPAIRWDAETKSYYFTQYLYTDSQFFGKKWPFVRLAKEYPPVMLPEEHEEKVIRNE